MLEPFQPRQLCRRQRRTNPFEQGPVQGHFKPRHAVDEFVLGAAGPLGRGSLDGTADTQVQQAVLDTDHKVHGQHLVITTPGPCPTYQALCDGFRCRAEQADFFRVPHPALVRPSVTRVDHDHRSRRTDHSHRSTEHEMLGLLSATDQRKRLRLGQHVQSHRGNLIDHADIFPDR
ncbi:hypothetical protein [Streptomyces sp. NPDC048252]|uniref:hypothetical protein n=1 Tax=Streptomyces sp. NPDC048252 TaxID=3154612 RepID=UPI003448D07F